MIDDTLLEAIEKMEKAVDHTKEELSGVRTGRANPAMFNKILVDYYGAPTTLQQLASLRIPEARVAEIQPYDKNSMAAIEKAIRDSDMGVNPSNDGAVIRIVFPQLTEERRKELIKIAHKRTEDGRIAVRAVRRHAKDALEKLMKDGDSGEDDVRRAEKELEDLTHKSIAAIDDLLKHKEAELLEV